MSLLPKAPQSSAVRYPTAKNDLPLSGVIDILKKSQSWSVDIILAVVLFMGAFFLFYALLGDNPSARTKNLRDDASSVIKQVSSEGVSVNILEKQQINLSRMNELKNLSYDELKRMLRVEGDFCIYLEDDKGYVIVLNNSYKGIGSPNINISNTPCNETIKKS